ncbi:MAG: MBL fold metallo-hydrolase [Lachnospiraceae bacterium]|nr:MBL fold metallo-hydrolase [Lachnospiraceae bacterium]
MKITFLGADHEVTGSCHYVEVGDKKFLVDCGMEQGPDIYENQEIPVAASGIDYVFVTHAHIDHSGLLPLLYSHGFRGQIFAQEATCALCDIMLKDSAHIQMSEAEWKNRKAKRAGEGEVEPLYDMEDVLGVLKLFVPVHYHKKVKVCDEITAEFYDAGHLLGSASISIDLTEGENHRTVVFSGDIGNPNRPLIKDPEYLTRADYVLMESTYGNRDHVKDADFAVGLAKIIDETLSLGGNLVIPAFSVGRTQEILYNIRRIKEEKLLTYVNPAFPVVMDSPLAVEATNVYKLNVTECFDDKAIDMISKGINPISFPGLKVAVSPDESKSINFDQTPKVIISASGMCEAGRIRHHLKHNLWRSNSTILFVGFQVPGTLGFNLLNGAKEVRLFGEEVKVAARIENLPGISGHADHGKLLEWIGAFEKPVQKVFVVHGDDDVVDKFAGEVQATTGFQAIAPYSGDSFDLLTGEQITTGNREKKQKAKTGKIRASSNVFMRLIASGQRLMHVIDRCEGMANKDLGKFADQINSLADKWDRDHK